MTTEEILKRAKAAKIIASQLSTDKKNRALLAMADCLEKQNQAILSANAIDIANAQGTISEVMIDRLALDKSRVSAMAEGLRAVAKLDDPVGVVLEEHRHAKGMLIQKVSVPLGVVAIIYESRPNVTSDAAALAIKSGNACVLRIGKEAYNSAKAIVDAMREGLESVGVSGDIINLIEDTSRESAHKLMTATGFIDLLIPRGGKGLIASCVENAKVPCIQTGTGICHIFVDESADIALALKVIENAKCSRPSVCNAMEVCLVHKNIADKFLPKLYQKLNCDRAENPVSFKLDKTAFKILGDNKNCTLATGDDFDTEFLDYIMAVGVVDGVNQAVEHISAHSTGHSDGIITANAANAEYFTRTVDSAAVYVNCSTRFTDGGEFGLGCEMGISTQKLHARGPMGLKELTTYKFVVKGDGNVR